MNALRFVTDGGMETDLIFHGGIDLPEFAAYPLLATASGRESLTDYYDGYARIAAERGVGLMLETPTWRANPDWGAALGHSLDDLTAANTEAIAFCHALRERYQNSPFGIAEIIVSGMIGPRGDGYAAAGGVDPDEAADYHSAQVEAFVTAGADRITAYTLTDAGEAIGIVRAVRRVNADRGSKRPLTVGIAFTVETDGSVPGGALLASTIDQVQAQEPADRYLINCAHPTHVMQAIDGAPWARRVTGLRCNASSRSHAELDEATELDEGDPIEFARDHGPLIEVLPNLESLGGCCGTDARHVAALWAAIR